MFSSLDCNSNLPPFPKRKWVFGTSFHFSGWAWSTGSLFFRGDEAPRLFVTALHSSVPTAALIIHVTTARENYVMGDSFFFLLFPSSEGWAGLLCPFFVTARPEPRCSFRGNSRMRRHQSRPKRVGSKEKILPSVMKYARWLSVAGKWFRQLRGGHTFFQRKKSRLVLVHVLRSWKIACLATCALSLFHAVSSVLFEK